MSIAGFTTPGDGEPLPTDTSNQERKNAALNARCVACGSESANGLHLRFAMESGQATADWQPSTQWESFRGVIHGGIVTTVLDEAMSQAVIGHGWEALTAELRVRLRARILPTERLRVCGWVTARHKREIWAEATLQDGTGAERAHAWAKFLGPPAHRPEEKQRPRTSQPAFDSAFVRRRPTA